MYLKTIYKADMLRVILQISFILSILLSAASVNAQFITTTDNENNIFFGTPDGDLDVYQNIENNPIEFSITTSGTPAGQIMLAINAFGVGPNDDIRVRLNGGYIGNLSACGANWGITMLNVPLNRWVDGKNKVVIYDGGGGFNPHIKVDWGQLIFDGGSRDGARLNDFELDHFTRILNFPNWWLYENLDITVSSGTYSTQIQLSEIGDLGNEQIVDFNYGSVSSSQVKTITLDYKNYFYSTNYICRAFLINNSTQEIVDFEVFKFSHSDPEGPVPFFMGFSNSTDLPTRDNVVITCSKFKNYNNLPISHIILPDGSTTTNTAFSYTVENNGDYKFTIVLTNATTYSFIHTVSNIDRTPPVLMLYGKATDTIIEGGSYTDAGAKAIDNFYGNISSSIVTVNNVDPLVPGNYTITYNVKDRLGNQADQIERHVEVLNKPLELKTASPTQSTTNVIFNGNLMYLGSTSITDHGFVWSYLPNPTLEVNIGKCHLGNISEKGAFQHTTTSLEMGATSHVRSYATNADGTVYGNDVEFTYNGINYGTLSIENGSYQVNEGSSVTIKIIRSGGTEGSITVKYATLNGNALAGADYSSKSGTLSFAAGETSKTVTIRTTSNPDYTGDKRFYFKLKNINHGAINRDQCYITIKEKQTKPVFGKSFIADEKGFSNPENEKAINFDVDLSSYNELISTGQLWVRMHAEKYSEDDLIPDDVSEITFYHSNNQIKHISNADNDWVILDDIRLVEPGVTNVRITLRGVAKGLIDYTPDVSFKNILIYAFDNVAPTITKITSNTGTYTFLDKIYIAVSLSERVNVSNAKLTLNTGNSTAGTATYIAGGETNCLLFEYSVREGDNKDNIIVTGITGITDYKRNELNTAGIPYTLSGVNVDGILPTITLTAQDNLSEWKKSHAIKTDVSNSDFQKYAWSQSESMPGAGWTSFNSGDIQTIKTGDGPWYLHVYASRNSGNSKYVHSSVVNLDNTAPQLTLTPSATDWTNTPVTITATVDEPHPGTITNPENSSTTATTLTYTANTNNTYSFTATDQAGNSATESITISNIDYTPPSITFSKNGSEGSWVDMARTVVSVDDADSGIHSFEYVWNNSTVPPASGWQSYSGTSTYLSDSTNGDRYLHVRATDEAGNSTVTSSLIFKVDNTKPQLTLNYTNPSDWTNSDIEVTVSASKTTGQVLDKIILPDGSEIPATSGMASGTFTISENGLYDFSAIDKAGNFTDKQILITNIDKEVPVLQYQLSTSDWTNSDITLTLSLDDNNSPIYNNEGYFVEYGSSGGLQIKENENGFTPYTSAFTKTIAENTSLTYEAKDALGNTIIQTITITNIDKNAPLVTTSNNNHNWQTADFQVELTFADDEEGIVAQQQYAVTNSTSTPSSYTDFNGPINFSSEGISYLHYKGVDAAGNINAGYFGPYKLDKTAPENFSLTVSTITSSAITVEGSTTDNVSGLHNTQPYQFAIDGTYGLWEKKPIKTFTGLVANKAYSFKIKAQDNAGLTTETAEITKYTLAADPIVELESNQSTQLKFKVTHNPNNETTPYAFFELKEMGAGPSGDNILTQSWTNSSSVTFNGLTAGTHYELWVTTRNKDNLENEKFKAVADAVTNRPPVANNISYTVYKGHTLAVSGSEGILFNDTDPDGNQLTAGLQSGPSEAQGTLNLNPNGSFTFIPADGFSGNVTFTYKANDGFVQSDNIATVTINVVVPTWNGTGDYTTATNWNGNEVPVSTDEIIVESGTMFVNSEAQYVKLTITGGDVRVNNGGVLTLGECDYSGDALQAANGGIIRINGDVSSRTVQKLKINTGIRINKGIKIPAD